MADPKATQAEVELARMLYDDPEMRPKIDEWVETKAPGTQARRATKQIVDQGLSELRKEKEAYQAELNAERIARAKQAERDALLRNSNLDIAEDDLPEIEKIRDERGMTHLEDAAVRYVRAREVARPRNAYAPLEIPGVNGGGGASFDWLKPAWANLKQGGGPVLDQVTRKEAARIIDAMARGEKFD